MQWWERFANQVFSPEWAADVLQTVAGAGLALAVAVLVLRKQLKHDRNLAREQRNEDLKLAVAQRHAEAAGMLGRRLILGATALRDLDDLGLIECVRNRDVGSWITDQVMPGLEDAHALNTEVSLVFDPREAKPFWSVWMKRLHEWSVFRSALLHLDSSQSLGPTNTEAFEHAFCSAVDERMTKTTAVLMEIGKSWVRWDGTGSFPSGTDVLGRHSLTDWPGVPLDAHWRRTQREEFLESIRARL